jgi:TRAP-type mannitol/chloroaromatic compound transport system permease small subunit
MVVIVVAGITLLVVLGISECIMRTAGFAGRSQEASQVTASTVGMPDLEENILIDLVG